MNAAASAVLEVMLPVYGVIAVGWLYARRHRPDMEVANHLNLLVFAPCLVFHALTTAPLDRGGLTVLVLCAAWVVLAGGLLALPLCRPLGLPVRTLLPTVMFNNAGTLGIPLSLLAFGERGLAPAVLVFMTEMCLHMTLGLRMLDARASIWALLRSPLVLAAAGGLAWAVLRLPLPGPVSTAVGMLGEVSIPLMLFALGVRLVDADWSLWRAGLAGALVRPAAGLLAVLPVLLLVDLPALERDVLLLFALLPPAVMNFLFAERYGPRPAETAAIVLVGTLVSLPVLGLGLAWVFAAPG